MSEAEREFEFINWVRKQLPPTPDDVLVGPGDDCAVIDHGGDKLLLKVDSVLEGTHFQLSDIDAPGYATARQLARKVMCRTISDIAAMGGVPRFALVATALPKGRDEAFRRDLLEGLREGGEPYGVAIVGGDTKSWGSDKGLALSVSMLGEMRGCEPVLRSGARSGDALFVTGELGGSILGGHLSFEPRLKEGRWLAEFGATAMIDLSDGLSGDLRHICNESSVGAVVEGNALPLSRDAHALSESSGLAPSIHAMHDGEDFELLFAVDDARAEAMSASWPFETRLSRIGALDDLVGNVRLRQGGEEVPLEPKSYEHRF